MAKLLNNEYSMISFKTYKENKSTTFLTVLLNLILLRGIAGSGTKQFQVTLTNENLYIDNIGYDMTGQLEVFVTEKINRQDIESLEVKKEGLKEIITLFKKNGKPTTYVRDNEDQLNLASELKKLISENAGIA